MILKKCEVRFGRDFPLYDTYISEIEFKFGIKQLHGVYNVKVRLDYLDFQKVLKGILSKP